MYTPWFSSLRLPQIERPRLLQLLLSAKDSSLYLPNVGRPGLLLFLLLFISPSSTSNHRTRQYSCRILRSLYYVSPLPPHIYLFRVFANAAAEYWKAYTPTIPLPPHLYLFRVFANAVAEYWEGWTPSLPLPPHLYLSWLFANQLPNIGKHVLFLSLFSTSLLLQSIRQCNSFAEYWEVRETLSMSKGFVSCRILGGLGAFLTWNFSPSPSSSLPICIYKSLEDSSFYSCRLLGGPGAFSTWNFSPYTSSPPPPPSSVKPPLILYSICEEKNSLFSIFYQGQPHEIGCTVRFVGTGKKEQCPVPKKHLFIIIQGWPLTWPVLVHSVITLCEDVNSRNYTESHKIL